MHRLSAELPHGIRRTVEPVKQARLLAVRADENPAPRADIEFDDVAAAHLADGGAGWRAGSRERPKLPERHRRQR